MISCFVFRMDELKATEFKRSLENAKTCRELMLVLKVRPTAVTELITIMVTKLFSQVIFQLSIVLMLVSHFIALKY